METALQAITFVLALVGLFDLCRRIKAFLQESVFISLRSPEKVLNWQIIQIAHASYVSAKKLHRLSRQLPRGAKRDQAVSTSKEYRDLRYRIYTNLKHSGFDRDEFITLCKKADLVMSKITGETQFKVSNMTNPDVSQ